tara:strand:+ start:17775 stop:20519 length:2745 start_codon:yes stop_codon:yes gene_type:complete
MYENLRFFKGLEYDLNFEKDILGIYQGSIYLPEVSEGLYETINLFILEECVLFGDPIVNFPTAETSDAATFTFKWEETNKVDSTSIIMYDIDNTGNIPVVKELKTQSFDLFDYSNVAVHTDGVKYLTTQNNTAIQINLALNSIIPGPHVRNLYVYHNASGVETLIAKIEIYGEVVAEDERLKVLLSNFGATLSEGDFMLFKDHDISEMSPDYILLNRKRKELLLELHNIKPFVGTYKAVLNAIDFFGYDKITLKEYWLNIDSSIKNFGKLFAIPVPHSSVRGEAIRKKLVFKLPSNTMKKTSKFSLVYRLNEPNGTFDEWDIPNVTETFDYTPEEVIIKLYGLKSKLQKEYLPLQAKIIDITAEGDYFDQRNLNIWHNQNPIGFFSEGHDVRFKVIPEHRDLFIEDLSMVLKPSLNQNNDAGNYNLFLNLGIGNEDNLTTANRTELKTVISKFYETYHDGELHSYNPNIPIGCPILLDGTDSFDDIWDEALFTWEDAEDPNGSLLITWNDWWKAWVYEIEWVVTSKERGYNQTYRGAIDDYLILPLILPYADSYSVEMRTYDLFGHRSHYRMNDVIDIKLKNLELYGIYKWLENQSWDNKKLSWNKSGGYWNSPQDNKTTIEENIATLYLTLDRANYVHLEEDQGVRFSTVRRYMDIYSPNGFSETTGPYQWDSSTFRWADSKNISWNFMRVGADLTSSFKINDIQQGDTLVIKHTHPVTGKISTGQHVISNTTPTTVNDVNGWTQIMDELNTSADSVISKFNFNAIFEDNDDDNINDVFRFILAVGREYSSTYDFSEVSITKVNAASNSNVTGETHVEHYNPTWDDTRVFSDYAEVERSTHITISTDISKFPGSKNAKWTITNITNPEITDIYYNNMWLTYIFKEPGYYSIQLEAEDTYGNKNLVKRNMLKVK